VCEEESEKASEYIHKLAGIYRYMIKSEDEDLVPLRDELDFVQKYIELLRVRFPEGFRVDLNIQENTLNKYVLPCALQLLIENAIKHNAVNADEPLIIKLETDDRHVWVSNNIIPKFGKIESTGLGQKYLRQQYLDLSGQNIEIKQTETEFKVTLPLI
jgi:LytS/YehU family sensor histidine kinase